MARKTVDFNQAGPGKHPNDKPVLYKIQTDTAKTHFAGIAKRGRVQEAAGRAATKPKGYIPSVKVQVEPIASPAEAL